MPVDMFTGLNYKYHEHLGIPPFLLWDSKLLMFIIFCVVFSLTFIYILWLSKSEAHNFIYPNSYLSLAKIS